MTGESLVEQLEYLLKQGATYDLAPHVGGEVFGRIDAFLARYIAYPSEHARHAHVLWIAHTWFMDVWRSTPRLLLVSPEAGCGKTFLMEVTGLLVPHADLIGDLTPAGLYSSIDESLQDCGRRPTILYDEVDTVFGPSSDAHQMRRLIDIGHDRRATVKRKIGKETVVFPVYCAMALAGKIDVGEVPSTIRTRSVVIPMQRAAPQEVARWDRRTSPAEVAPLCYLLQLWAELVHAHAHEHLTEMPDELNNRDADVWEPLLTVADLAGGHWPQTARVTAVTVVTGWGVRGPEPSRGVRLLEDIRAVFDSQRVDRMFTEKLLRELRNLDESPWGALKPISLAQLLRRYGVEPELQRVGETVRRGYQREYFTDAWLRYLPQPVTAVTPATPRGASDE